MPRCFCRQCSRVGWQCVRVCKDFPLYFYQQQNQIIAISSDQSNLFPNKWNLLFCPISRKLWAINSLWSGVKINHVTVRECLKKPLWRRHVVLHTYKEEEDDWRETKNVAHKFNQCIAIACKFYGSKWCMQPIRKCTIIRVNEAAHRGVNNFVEVWLGLFWPRFAWVNKFRPESILLTFSSFFQAFHCNHWTELCSLRFALIFSLLFFYFHDFLVFYLQFSLKFWYKEMPKLPSK